MLTSFYKKGAIIMALQHTIKAVIRKGDTHYVGECVEIAVVTQGVTIDETVKNLQEAVALHLDGEDLEEMGLAPNPTLILTMEVEPAYA
jgi:predicted RNase H-like HicB family nuclease